MGTVYRAVHRRLRQQRAVKVLPSTLAADPTFIQRFEREARLAAELRHPNIVVVHDVDDADGVHYIAMELLEGRSLRDLIREESPIPLARALALIDQLASAAGFRARTRRRPPRRQARQHLREHDRLAGRAANRSPDPRRLRDRAGCRQHRPDRHRPHGHDQSTWRRRCSAGRSRVHRRTCTRSASSRTSCWPAGRRSRGGEHAGDHVRPRAHPAAAIAHDPSGPIPGD